MAAQLPVAPAPVPQPLAEEDEGAMDAKTSLNQFCQRLCQRPVTRVDIEYTVNKIGVQFQAIVKLNCIQGQEFAGELASSPKDAEKAAAGQALKAHSMTINSLPPTVPGRQKKKTEKTAARNADGSPVTTKPPDEDNPALTDKVKLNSVCMRVVKRALAKGETDYDTRAVVGGFHTTLKLLCLPEEWAVKAWAGKVSSTKQAAEQSAAAYALEAIEADEALMAIAAKGKPPKEGKGKGKASPKGKGFGKGKKGVDLGALTDAMMPWFKPPRPSGPDLTRESLTEEPVQGVVLEWKPGGNFGWLKLDTPFEHTNARTDGKVYAHKKDIACEVDALTTGTSVKFTLYSDTAGLGAGSVALA